jgi:hypothetical protein
MHMSPNSSFELCHVCHLSWITSVASISIRTYPQPRISSVECTSHTAVLHTDMPFCKQYENWRKPSSGVWRRVYVVDWTDVSEDRIASIFRVEKPARKQPAWTSYQSITSTRRHTPEDGFLHSHRRENLKSYNMKTVLHLILTCHV